MHNEKGQTAIDLMKAEMGDRYDELLGIEERKAAPMVKEHGGDRKGPDQVDNVNLKTQGGDRKGQDQGDNVTLKTQRGNRREYIVGRLKRESAADPKAGELLDLICQKKISAAEARRRMGWESADR